MGFINAIMLRRRVARADREARKRDIIKRQVEAMFDEARANTDAVEEKRICLRTRSEWPLICTKIAKGFEDERQSFFSGSIKIIEEARTWEDPIDIPIVNRRLGGVAELALKAYQLGIASSVVARNAYIPSAEGREFANLLYAQVCGTAIHEVLHFLQSYDEVAKDQHVRDARLAGDIGHYITGKRSRGSEAATADATKPNLGVAP